MVILGFVICFSFACAGFLIAGMCAALPKDGPLVEAEAGDQGSRKTANGYGRRGAMKSTVVKRSVIIAGQKTSVSLEDAFWEG